MAEKGDLLLSYAFATVSHLHHYLTLFLVIAHENEYEATICELDSILDEIDQHLFKSNFIAYEGAWQLATLELWIVSLELCKWVHVLPLVILSSHSLHGQEELFTSHLFTEYLEDKLDGFLGVEAIFDDRKLTLTNSF